MIPLPHRERLGEGVDIAGGSRTRFLSLTGVAQLSSTRWSVQNFAIGTIRSLEFDRQASKSSPISGMSLAQAGSFLFGFFIGFIRDVDTSIRVG